MAKYTQTNRPLKVFTPLGDDAVLLTGFRGREAISELFSFELDLVAENATAIAFERLLGQKASVSLRLGDGKERILTGIIRRFAQGDRDAEFTRYQAELVPQFWFWTKKVQSRVFQQMTVVDILRKVLDGLNVPFQQLTQEYPRREYCVQYQESDFAFASRLMEDEGIHYYFTHTADKDQLVLSDAAQSHPDVPGATQLTYDRSTEGVRAWPRATSWRKTQEIRAGKNTTWDYNFELPTQHLEASIAARPATVSVGTVSHQLLGGANSGLEIYEYPGGYARHYDDVGPGGEDRAADLNKVFDAGPRIARIRAEAEAAEGLAIEATTDAGHLLPGLAFSLTGHVDANGKYFLRDVTHAALLSGLKGDDVKLEYSNRCTCLPIDLPYRPARRTPKPLINGTQTARVVTTAADQEIFVDKYGRVKVQFPWDREGKSDAASSCWIRVAQIWAGKTWGAFFWPRLGHEVVVSFEQGDPDRPLIVGSVYNAVNMPPVALPADATVAGIKSCIFSGEPGVNFNAILFHDTIGVEYVHVHSEKTQMENSIQDHVQLTNGCSIRFSGGI